MKRVVVIGGGPGGYTAAIKAAKLGAQVNLVEAGEIGGVCTNWGCIPTKIYKNAANIMEIQKLALSFGVEYNVPHLDFLHLFSFKRKVVQQFQMGIKNLLKDAGVNLIEGKGRFINERKIEIISENETLELEADGFIVATGSYPKTLPVPGGDLDGIWTNKEILETSELPSEIAIIGGGVVGIEFAFILSVFGVDVTVVELLPYILPGMEKEVVEFVENTLQRKFGVKLLLGQTVESINFKDNKFILALVSGEKLKTDNVLVAIGREPADTSGLLTLGAQAERKLVKRNRYLETSIPNIYAIGDFAGEPFLAHKAYLEGEIAAINLVEGKRMTVNLDFIPKAIFTTPEIGSVGLSENEAKDRGYEVRIMRYNLAMLGRAAIDAKREGFVKIITEEKTGKLLGIHIVGHNATEILAAATIAVAKGLTVRDFENFVFAHPTMSEAIRETIFLN